MKSTASLLSMPLEVLLHITSYSTTKDYGSLRATCKHIEASLFKSFAKEFFSKRQFTVTEFSLNALIEISKSRFAPSVTYLIIHLERPVRGIFQPIFPFPDSAVDRALRQNIFREHYFSHLELVDTGRDLELLTEALKNLPKLEAIGLRDFNSRGRYREGGDWESYGTPTFLAQTGARLERPDTSANHNLDRDSSKYVCHVFLMMLRALGNARGFQPSPTRLEVILRRCQLPDRAFSIPRYLEDKILPVLAGLKALFVVHNYNFPGFMVADENGTSAKNYPMFLLSNFLLKTPALEHLRLNFDGHDNTLAEMLLEWLAQKPRDSSASIPIGSRTSPTGLPLIPPSPELPYLAHLEIGAATVRYQTLLAVYEKFKPTLRSISLHKVSLLHPRPQDQDKTNLWAKLCNQMAKLDLALTNIKLSYVSQQHEGLSHRCPVNFSGMANPYVKEWTGSDLGHALKEFVDSLKVHWLEDQIEDDEEEDDLDDDEDEEAVTSDSDEDEEEDDDDDDDLLAAPMTFNEVVAIALGQDQF
ncbi:hypothetical protein F4809DRAFT_623378 [Biscogniauxia mediterranea]|nr:hypothetical protein F4809DRAFT_623378 [Biscogniauxia mediterranea]